MRIVVRHGYFSFYPRNAEELSRIQNIYDLELQRVQDFYTFARLVEAKDYSLIGAPYLNLTANKTFEGKPWEVMRENSFVYHMETQLLLPKTSITTVIDLPLINHYYLVENALIQPGSRLRSGEQIISYDAEFEFRTYELKVMEVGLV